MKIRSYFLTIKQLKLASLGFFTLVLVACGGGGGETGGTTGGIPEDTTGGTSGGTSGITDGTDEVQASLDALNVDTTQTPRVNSNGAALPEDYTPLGSSETLLKRSELFVAGIARKDETSPVSLLKYVPATDGSGRMTNLAPNLDNTWAQTDVHAAIGGDVDGDGFDEVVVAWHDSTNMAIKLKVFQDAAESYVESAESIITTAEPDWMALATGDFNGDGSDQIAVAIVDDTAGNVTLYFLSGSSSGTYAVENSSIKTWDAAVANSRLGIEMSTGRLDRDTGEELVVVINESFGQGRNSSPGDGISTYYIYDDQNAGYAQLASERIAALIDNSSYLGVVGTVALGDVDGDGMDEMLIAAMDSFPVECQDVSSLQLVYDDLDAQSQLLASRYDFANISNCESSGNNGWTSHLWAGTLNLDGDEPEELHVNGVVYDDFLNSNGEFVEIAEIPTRYIYRGGGNNDRARTTRANTTMVTGDVTGDGREDIIVYQPKSIKVGTGTSGNSTFDITALAISVWSIKEVPGDAFEVSHVEEIEFGNTDYPNSPVILVPVNVDNDSTILQSVTNSHELVFSEPIVHAALAAPPCWNTGVQQTDECRTAWGQGTSVSADASISHTISSKAHVGVSADFSLPFVGTVAEGEIEKTAGVSLTAEASLGYELTRTHTYTTGSMEDTVIATVIPYDRYTYKVLAHPLYEDLVGEEITISLPRRPRTIQIERSFYNSSIVGDGARIDNSVFSHTIGNPRSYPSAPSGFLHTKFGPFDVGLSRGSQTADISEARVAGFSASVAVSYETTVKATAGKVMGGFSVGSETSATLGVSAGDLVSFSGTVGDINPADGIDDDLDYSFGIFAYKQSSGAQDRPFQVINYWVE